MKKYRQQNDDCFRTCIGCLLEVEPTEIIDFKQLFFFGNDDNGVPIWHVRLEEWLNERGYSRRLATEEEIESDELLIAIGAAAGTGRNHAEIYAKGEMVYDPSGNDAPLKEIYAYQKLEKI